MSVGPSPGLRSPGLHPAAESVPSLRPRRNLVSLHLVLAGIAQTQAPGAGGQSSSMHRSKKSPPKRALGYEPVSSRFQHRLLVCLEIAVDPAFASDILNQLRDCLLA